MTAIRRITRLHQYVSTIVVYSDSKVTPRNGTFGGPDR